MPKKNTMSYIQGQIIHYNMSKEATMSNIRWMIRRDMQEVLQIEEDNFTSPWTEEEFLNVLGKRSCIGMIYEKDNKILGFIIYELCKSKLRILSIAVHIDHHRQGIGKQLIEKIIGKLSSDRRTKLNCKVRESNLAAQLFLRRMGFKATRVMRNYYEDHSEDAYCMQYVLQENAHLTIIQHD